MAGYEKFLPPSDLPDFHTPFWSAVREHRLVLQKCSDCDTHRFIPTELCGCCGSQTYSWVPVSGRGRVYTFTIIRRAPTPAYQADVPYLIAHVELDEGPRMISNLIGVEPEAVRIGQQVQVVFEDVAEGATLFKFTPSEDAHG